VNATLGDIGVWLGFAAALVGIAVSAVALRRSATRREVDVRLDSRPYAVLILAGGVLATLAMEHALVSHDFTIAFVADNNSRATPLLYSITGLWSALALSLIHI